MVLSINCLENLRKPRNFEEVCMDKVLRKRRGSVASMSMEPTNYYDIVIDYSYKYAYYYFHPPYLVYQSI